MSYIPRAPESAICQNCGKSYLSNHRRRRYCSNSCNVLASQRRKQAGSAVFSPVTARKSFEIPERVRDLIGPVMVAGPIFYITDEAGKHIQVAQYLAEKAVYWHTTGNPMGYSAGDGGSATGMYIYVGEDGSIWLKTYRGSQLYFRVETIDIERMTEYERQKAEAKYREANHLFWYSGLE